MLKDVLNYVIYKFNQIKEHNMIYELALNKIFKIKNENTNILDTKSEIKVNKKINDNIITQQELVQLCRELNIQGYQGLSRNRLLDLFMEYIRENQ